MSDNSGCVTGILIDISNVNDSETVKSSSESTFSLRKSLDFGFLRQHETTTKVPTETLKFSRPTKRFKRIRRLSLNVDDSESIEDEIFDFDCFPKSPNSSFNLDYDYSSEWSTKENEDSGKWSSNEEMCLNTEELAEVFREATTVAVKLENYVQKRNRTPVKSPNHMKLFLERSAQKKLKERSTKEVEVKAEESICETNEVETKNEAVKVNLLPKLIEIPATPAFKKAVNPISAKAVVPSLTNFRTKAQSSSIARSGPLKAIPIVKKQTNTSTFQPSSSLAPKSVIPSKLLNSSTVQNRTSVARSNSSVLRPASRPVLNRCNSFHSEVTTPKTTVVTPKPQSRRSFSGFTPSSTTPAPIVRSKRTSLLAVPTPTLTVSSRTAKATPLSSKKPFAGSVKATPLRAAKKFF